MKKINQLRQKKNRDIPFVTQQLAFELRENGQKSTICDRLRYKSLKPVKREPMALFFVQQAGRRRPLCLYLWYSAMWS